MTNKVYISTSNASLIQSSQTIAISSLGFLWSMGPINEMRTVKAIPSSRWAWMVLDGNSGNISTTNKGPDTSNKTIKVATSVADVTSTFAPTPPVESPPIIPSLTALFTVVSSSNVAGVGLHYFTDATSYNDYPAGTVTGTWNLGDGTTYAYTYLSGGFGHFYGTGSFTASLTLTESVTNITSSATKYITLIPPTLTASFTFTSHSNGADDSYEPMTANLSATTSYNGGGSETYNWYFRTGSVVVSQSVGFVTPTFTGIFNYGTYTASLQVTESTFNITALATQTFVVNT